MMNDILEVIGWLATVIALAGIWMNNRRQQACFVLWLVSNALTFGIHSCVAMWAMAVRDLAFFVLAIHGWRLWGSRKVVEYEHTDRQGIGR